MSDLSPEEYQKQYDAAAAALDAGAAPAIPPVEAAVTPEVAEPVAEAPKVDEAAPPAVDEVKELRERLERAEKAAADNKAWGTKNAQRLAEIERERQLQQREQSRPAILDTNPELVDAIRYVASDPAPQQAAEKQQNDWMAAVDTAHPGIFAADADPELINALVAKREASAGAWDDPLVAIRDIAAEKVAHAERVAIKRYQVESQKQAAKSAMSVPAAGGGAARTAPDPSADEVNRIKNMSSADFARERSKVLGY